ncbi:hypothetical protein E2C01_055450 [Portunus trituberculatus]|uniref:Uncharacterized protein n=1 Tax=Portunus trituberculatus TaxID=210409 RepID=A0A5B7GWV4_PORTR|nr:hypothetical protein [Portunus trituberculatus]
MYRSNLKAMMILPRLPLPFDSLEELIESGISCYVVPATKLHNAILDADPDSQFGRFRSQIVVHNNQGRAIRDLIQGKHAAVAVHIALLNIIHSTYRNTATCPIYIASEAVQPEWNFFVYEKNSSLRVKVDMIIRRLREAGILERLFMEEQRDARYCLQGGASDPLVNKLRALEFKDYYGVLMVYCGGMMLAAMTLLMEVVRGVVNTTHGSSIIYPFVSVPPARVPWIGALPAAPAGLK